MFLYNITSTPYSKTRHLGPKNHRKSVTRPSSVVYESLNMHMVYESLNMHTIYEICMKTAKKQRKLILNPSKSKSRRSWNFIKPNIAKRKTTRKWWNYLSFNLNIKKIGLNVLYVVRIDPGCLLVMDSHNRYTIWSLMYFKQIIIYALK